LAQIKCNVETCTGMGIAGIPRNPRESRADGMEANVEGFPCGWKQMSWDSRGDGTKLCGIPAGVQLYLTFMVHVRQKLLSKLVKDVCCDFTDTNCIAIS